jgi:hypothetical protein
VLSIQWPGGESPSQPDKGEALGKCRTAAASLTAGDLAGVYGAAGAGIAFSTGVRAIVLTNHKGAVLELADVGMPKMIASDLRRQGAERY